MKRGYTQDPERRARLKTIHEWEKRVIPQPDLKVLPDGRKRARVAGESTKRVPTPAMIRESVRLVSRTCRYCGAALVSRGCIFATHVRWCRARIGKEDRRKFMQDIRDRKDLLSPEQRASGWARAYLELKRVEKNGVHFDENRVESDHDSKKN